ncbi:DUF6461 domain-containing protein [Streptosporangium roseum]|uniref:Uncharacterized protein n=1 Tax=Streptosporangium roseum (strain ATCC 12428 / DSM 43021 / JCM 3005 / KCTC 9067 / NCIMB 10171 / NRRL 2505 / NI 9100) TaxID=479432 RepID=D2B8W0_STRRD|nr:DUF6461 domain-containing protein [Streptosporangium roseum]ACZ89716.1 hypothetical protein Sros_7017 [Streptosporangium roseum DSM 43021]
MTECPEEFRWLSGREELGEIYCVSFVRGLSPEEVLRRFGVDESTMEEGVTSEELDERSVESMRDDAAGYIGAAKIGDWTLVIEPGGWKIAVDSDIYAPVSRGTEVVSVCHHESASDSFAYIVDGESAVHFDPMCPGDRSGSDPDLFIKEMREVGLDPEHDIDIANSFIDFPMERSFALASRITSLPFSSEMLELRFLGAEPLEG